MTCYHPIKSVLLKLSDVDNVLLYGYDRDQLLWNFNVNDGKIFYGGRDYRLSCCEDVKEVSVPCNKCVGCRLDYARSWTCRLMCEQQTLQEDGINEACFITLTYDNEHLPTGNTLLPSDVSAFMKRLREFYSRVFGVQNIRFFAAGEYGEMRYRPHYHLILFGVDFAEPYRLQQLTSARNASFIRKDAIKKLDTLEGISPKLLEAPIPHYHGNSVTYSMPILEKLWNKGRVDVGTCNVHSMGYVSRYSCKLFLEMSDEERKIYTPKTRLNALSVVSKEMDGIDVCKYREELKNMVKTGLERPFIRMSNRPGIGYEFFNRYHDSIYNAGIHFCISEGNVKNFGVPRYFDKKLKEIDVERYKVVKQERLQALLDPLFIADHTPERLATKEALKLIQYKKLCRNLDNDAAYREFAQVMRLCE